MEHFRQGAKVFSFLIAIGFLGYQLSIALKSILNPPMMMTMSTVDVTDSSVPAPLVYICPLDQYNNTKLREYGYNEAFEMLEGKIDSNDFIPKSWGGNNHNMSFEELVRAVIDIEPENKAKYFKGDLKPVLFPKFGYCFERKIDVAKMTFIQPLQEEKNVSIFLTDKQTKTHYGVNIGSMMGDMITVMPLTKSMYSYSIELEMY